MKTLIIGIIMSLPFNYLFAQNPSNFQLLIDSIYMELDTSDMAAKVLLHKSIMGKMTESYNETNDSISDFNKWFILYNAMKSSSYERAGFLKYEDFAEIIRENSQNRIIPIVAINYNYNIFKSNALDSNLIDTISGIVFDVEERIENPYEVRKLFSATPVLDFSTEDTVRFMFDSLHYFTNDNVGVSEISIDFGDGGGFRTINFNEIISIVYATEGKKNIQIRVTLNNTVELNAYSEIAFKKTWVYPLDEEGFISGTIPYEAEADVAMD